YRLSRALARAFPGRAIVDTFDLEEYAEAGRCTALQRATPHAQIETGWRRTRGLQRSVVSGVFDVRWEDREFVVARATWPEGYRSRESWYVIGAERGAVEAFTSAVCTFCNEPRQAVLAFR